MSVEVDTKELDDLTARLQSYPERFQNKSSIVQADFAQVLLQEIRDRAPKQTGAYANSWHKRYLGDYWHLGTNAPQARRLEKGFYGTDSLGRNYKQAAQPHVAPAVQVIQEKYTRAYRALIIQVWKDNR